MPTKPRDHLLVTTALPREVKSAAAVQDVAVGNPQDHPKPKKFHLDKRAELLLALSHYHTGDGGAEDDDDLLNTRQVADLLNVSPQWVVLGRSKGYGPKFIKVSTRRVSYRRSAVRAWLTERTYSSTGEYSKTRETA